VTFSINVTKYKGQSAYPTLSITMLYHYAECGILVIVMLNVIVLNVILLSVIILSVVMLSVVAPFERLFLCY
jgi:hypothetical protein